MEIKKIIKIIFGVLVTILLGAIGSGVWDKLLSPALSMAGNFITSTISSISQSYSDSIYSNASYLVTFDQTKCVQILLMLFIFFGLFAYAISTKKDHKLISPVYRVMISYCRGWNGIIVSGALVIVLFFIMATDATIREIRYYSTKNMEIVRPYIGENQYLMLRSEYLSMKNKDDFDNFLESLYTEASKIPIKIEKYETK